MLSPFTHFDLSYQLSTLMLSNPKVCQTRELFINDCYHILCINLLLLSMMKFQNWVSTSCINDIIWIKSRISHHLQHKCNAYTHLKAKLYKSLIKKWIFGRQYPYHHFLQYIDKNHLSYYTHYTPLSIMLYW